MISRDWPSRSKSCSTREARHHQIPPARSGTQLKGSAGGLASSWIFSQVQKRGTASAVRSACCQNNPRACSISRKPSRLLTSRTNKRRQQRRQSCARTCRGPSAFPRSSQQVIQQAVSGQAGQRKPGGQGQVECHPARRARSGAPAWRPSRSQSSNTKWHNPTATGRWAGKPASAGWN